MGRADVFVLREISLAPSRWGRAGRRDVKEGCKAEKGVQEYETLAQMLWIRKVTCSRESFHWQAETNAEPLAMQPWESREKQAISFSFSFSTPKS